MRHFVPKHFLYLFPRRLSVRTWLWLIYPPSPPLRKHRRAVYEAGYAPICPALFLPLFLNDPVPQEHKDGLDMARDLLRRSRVLVVCGHTVTEAMKNDIAVAQRLGITSTTLEGILTVKGQGRPRSRE